MTPATRPAQPAATPGASKGLRDRVAAWLIARDDCTGDQKPSEHIEWPTAFLSAHRCSEHGGDCPLAQHKAPVTCSRCVCDDALKQADDLLALAAIASAPEQGVGLTKGWVVVPREPTEEMLNAGWDAYAAHEWDAGRAKRGPEREALPVAYRALIAAAPAPSHEEA